MKALYVSNYHPAADVFLTSKYDLSHPAVDVDAGANIVLL